MGGYQDIIPINGCEVTNPIIVTARNMVWWLNTYPERNRWSWYKNLASGTTAFIEQPTYIQRSFNTATWGLAVCYEGKREASTIIAMRWEQEIKFHHIIYSHAQLPGDYIFAVLYWYLSL